ncbi:MAG TPA: hypothetical protein VJB94_01415 [Candidatus Nanoarchaeia archaeon]|nr:hypothetical protein [Candidatus Nanoarchaeia archaeon]
MKIAVDLDEVLADFMIGFLNHYNNKHETNFAISDFKQFDLEKTFSTTKEQAIHEVYDFIEKGGYQKLSPVEGSISGTKRLSEIGRKLIVVTSRQKECKRDILNNG